MKFINLLVIVLFSAFIAGCPSQNARITQGGDQLKLRNMQTRAFDTADKNMVVRNVVSTLQDLSFVIDKADSDLGTVSATRLSGYQIRMTVTVRPSDNRLLVRANAQYNLKAIEDPVLYQDFFSALQKSMFLAANEIE